MSKYTYSIRSYYPEYKEPWVTFKKDLNRQYAEGYFFALRESPSPRPHTQLVRSDGKVVDEFEAHEEVHIGMVAGFATAEQLRRAAQKALERADRIDKMNIKILGKIKNRFGDDLIKMPEDIWTNNKYRIRFDQTGEWERISYDIGVASIIELGIIEE
jgi:hypothetical protein